MDNENKIDEAVDNAEMSAQKLEELLMENGIMIPANDLVHYMTRNASYMKVVHSEQFKESGIKLEEILTDEFIHEQFELNAKTAEVMRYVTEKVVAQMQEVDTKDVQIEEAIEVAGEIIK